MKKEALRVERLCIRDEGETLVKDVSFTLYQGELVSISGYHHTGKSVLASALIGERPLAEGRITMPDGQSPQRSISRIEYNASVMVDYSIAENLFVFVKQPMHQRLIVPKRKIRENTKAILNMLDLDFQPDTPMSELTPSERHLLLLAKAVWHGASVVMMDNIAIEYNAEEYARLLRVLRRFPQMSYLYITTRFDPIVAATDRVLCFRDKRIGAVLFHGDFSESTYYKAMHGSDDDADSPRLAPVLQDEHRLALKLEPKAGSGGIPIRVFKGEIIGVLDVYGSYWMHLVPMMFDSTVYDICLEDEPVHSLEQALRKGVRVVRTPTQNMIFPHMSVFDNVTLGIVRRYSRFGVINQRLLRYAYKEQLPDERQLQDKDSLRVNKRMLVLARCAVASPKVLILENLLFGLGSPAKNQMYEKIQAIAQKGTAVILISSSATECKTLCSRTLILRDAHTYFWN